MLKRILAVSLLLCAVVFPVSAISSRYVYNTLSEKDRALYERMDAAILSCTEQIDATGYSKEDCLRIYSDYLDDHPGVFWCDNGITYTTGMTRDGSFTHGVKFSYTHQENLKADKITFVNLVEYFHNYIKNDVNDWFKLFHIYEYLTSTIVYDNNYIDQSMWSVFFNGIGVCAGFARSFQYLALLEGIPCLIVTGYERDDNGNPGTVLHAWCMAQLEGNWYHFDPTWGIKDSNGNIDYTYFCRSQERMEKTHVIDNAYPIPDAIDDSLSYARVRHRYIEQYSFLDMQEIFRTAFDRGENTVSIEFSSDIEFEKAVKDLIENKSISMIFKNLNMDIKSFSYSKNNIGYVLTVSMVI